MQIDPGTSLQRLLIQTDLTMFSQHRPGWPKKKNTDPSSTCRRLPGGFDLLL